MFSHHDSNLHSPADKQVEHLSVFVWAPQVSPFVNCLLICVPGQFSTVWFIFFLWIYCSSLGNLDTTPMSMIPQGMVVSFCFQEREEDPFRELQTMKSDINSRTD